MAADQGARRSGATRGRVRHHRGTARQRKCERRAHAAAAQAPNAEHGAEEEDAEKARRRYRAAARRRPTARNCRSALAPQLATPRRLLRPAAGDWIYEIKFDGYRVLARIDGSDVRLFTRRGHDWTSRLKHLAQAVAALKLPNGWIDGEIVIEAEDGKGRTDFQALQNAFDTSTTGGHSLPGVSIFLTTPITICVRFRCASAATCCGS